jgi:hypothetical protein
MWGMACHKPRAFSNKARMRQDRLIGFEIGTANFASRKGAKTQRSYSFLVFAP